MDVSNYKEITLEVNEHIAILTLNRPEHRNSLTSQMLNEEMPAAIEEIRRNDDVRAVILTGSGKDFCAGGDVRMLDNVDSSEPLKGAGGRHIVVRPIPYVAKNLQLLSKPTIAAINGPAVGAGLSIAALCDFRIATQEAKFGAIFVRRGLPPDTGSTYTLTRILGITQALRLMLLGETIDAAEAKQIGLVSQVVPSEQLMPTCMEMAQRLATLPPVAVELTKQAAYRAMNNDLESQLYIESRAMNICMGTEDFKEGIRSFLEKRQPEYKGK